MFFIVADRATDATLGFLQITDMDLIDRRAELGICLIRESQRRGIGSESLHLVSAYLRDIWNCRKLSLRVRA
ncbi:MAG: GNAT family N-acetyltransferase [Gammaproteobacteria bacterium]|nr:GNAT family N-acetyltransferase [Gammaproteobacteria bacterium]